MNGIGLSFTVIAGALILCLPRRLAILPLLLAAAYMTRGQALDLGGASLTVLRVLVPIGLIRVMLRGESLANGWNAIDAMMILWAVVLLGTSPWHQFGAWQFRSGLVWSDLGCYFLLRVFLAEPADVERAFKLVCLVMAPVAVFMLFEKATGTNLFGVLGGVLSLVVFRTSPRATCERAAHSSIRSWPARPGPPSSAWPPACGGAIGTCRCWASSPAAGSWPPALPAARC